MSKLRVGCLAIFLFLLCCGLFIVFMTVAVGNRGTLLDQEPRFEETLIQSGENNTNAKIAVIDIRGIISSSIDGDLGQTMVEDIKIALRQAAEDNDVKAIVLHVDSPGGEVTASDIIYNAVCETREIKPVIVYMGSLAASGGYYVACGGSHLMASDTTITGSIGVIIQALNYQELLGKVGLESVVFKSGQFKDILSGSREMTAEEKAYIQGLVMQTYDRFVGIVAQERKLPLDGLKTGVADGRIVSGHDALQHKLIDQIGYIEDAYSKAMEEGNAPGAKVIRYNPPFKLGKLFNAFGQAKASQTIEIDLSNRLAPRLEPGKLYLLPGFYAQ